MQYLLSTTNKQKKSHVCDEVNMSGKGSAPRKGANQKAYEENWEKIFGKKTKEEKPKQDKDSAPKR